MRIRRRYHLHWPGVIFVVLTVLIGIAASQRRENLLVWVFASMLAWIIVSGIISGAMMMAVRAVRIAPRHGRVGEWLRIQYKVSSQSIIWPLFDIRIQEMVSGKWHYAHLSYCHRGESVIADGDFFPEMRGPLKLKKYRCFSGFPFGLIMKSVEFSQDVEILVHPQLLDLHSNTLRRLLSTRGGDGLRAHSARGAGEEFHGLREYRAGDSLRSVAWRRSASLPDLVVIDRAAPMPRRLAVVLDLRITDTPHTIELEEQAIALTASLLSHAEQSGWEISLEILGCAAPHLPMRRGGRHQLQILDALAGIDLAMPRSTQSSLRDIRKGFFLTIHPGKEIRRAIQGDSISISASNIAEYCREIPND
ncbi:MAG: DUF58 domain-containing protein [Planctomycetota bacterium]|nr:DUF58 domain-containing protein [Planctomycetota bacterium]MDA1262475.1 DUF58 domain-containing protein [Planctomycetota bacterium]